MSSDSSSGTSLDTASTNTGPMGAGGGWGSEDADHKQNISCILRSWLGNELTCLFKIN